MEVVLFVCMYIYMKPDSIIINLYYRFFKVFDFVHLTSWCSCGMVHTLFNIAIFASRQHHFVIELNAGRLPDHSLLKTGLLLSMKAGTTSDLLGDLPISRKNAPARVDPNGYKIVSIRFRQAEFESFSEQVQGIGLTHNLALRIAARRITGFLEIDAETRQHLRQISSDISEISISLRHLTRIAAQTDTIDLEALNELGAEFRREFAMLNDRLQTILNVSQRRLDGRAMLAGASAAGVRSGPDK